MDKELQASSSAAAILLNSTEIPLLSKVEMDGMAEDAKVAVMKGINLTLRAMENCSDPVLEDGLQSSSAIFNDMQPIINLIMIVPVVLITLAMGCEIQWGNLVTNAKRPLAMCIGMVAQFCFLPLSAYLILVLTSTDHIHATCILIVACCPGGIISNVFTYFANGDVSLSIAMTTLSTLVAMGTLPANFWLYGRSFESKDLIIPYKKMLLSLVMGLSPVTMGMLLRWKLPKVAMWIAKVGSRTGLLVILIGGSLQAVALFHKFAAVSVQLYAIILTLPLVGLTLGYGSAALLNQGVPVRRTIAFECGMQNIPLAVTIIVLSFPLEIQEEMLLFPYLYALTMLGAGSVICLACHFSKNCACVQTTNEDRILSQVSSPKLKEGALYFEEESLMTSNQT